MRLPDAVAGLPPAKPPIPPALFVYPLARDSPSSWLGAQRARPHTRLGAWTGQRAYEGMILSFFSSVADARTALRADRPLFGGTRVRNVVASWDQLSVPTKVVQATVLGCLRSVPGRPVPKRTRRAGLATFAGYWGGHTRGLSINPGGEGAESVSSGCCIREYKMTFEILSVSGTLTRATAAFRVTSFRRYDRAVKLVRVGETGKLLLRNGIVTNTLTDAYFCSEPAWGATGACGA